MADRNSQKALRLYGIKNCDTIKKAKRWLDERQIPFLFHDYRQDGISRELLQDFITRAGWQTLLNTHGTTWRKLSDELRQGALRPEGALELMLDQPAIIKRPVLQSGDGRLLVGFSPETYQKFIQGEA